MGKEVEARTREGERKGGGSGMSKQGARTGLQKVQLVMGLAFFASAAAGAYLLATDGSLWNLAFSHAVGLVAIALIDAALGIANVTSMRRAYVPSMAAALLGFLLQLGDILTAPQYGMTVTYFASYLFGLWAFDLLLGLQVAVIVAGVAGRGYARHLSRLKTRRGRDLSYSRREFVRVFVGFGAAIAFAVGLGSIKLPAPSAQKLQTTTTAHSIQAAGAIANTNDLVVNSPVYFEYPSGYPSMLLKKADGSLIALSMLCTHVCCQCSYDNGSNAIFCPCHGSLFDQSGNVVRGPANLPLPKIELNVDSKGNVFPVKVNGTSPCMP
jgi:arsenite oxidase small subunit